MKKCYKCNVNINSAGTTCPLCNSTIEEEVIEENVFPVIPSMYTKNALFFKLLLFASILGSIICTVINYIVSNKISWSLFVTAGIVSFWVTFITGIKKRNHFMKLLFSEVILVMIASILWDYFTGWHLWSLTYVIPFLSIAYISTLFFLRIFIKNVFKDYIIYIYINSLIGIIPLYFIFKDVVTNNWPSIFCVLFSFCSILSLAIFNHKQMKNEIERRLHI